MSFKVSNLAAKVDNELNKPNEDPGPTKTIRGSCLANWHATDLLAKSVFRSNGQILQKSLYQFNL